MVARRRRKAGGAERRLLLADAGMLAGFRRAHPTLAQLDEALHDLRTDESLTVIVLADAALRRDLPVDEQDTFERYRGDGTVVCAAAGSDGGHTGFMRAVADRAAEKGTFSEVLVLTARDLGRGKWQLVRLARIDGRWAISNSSPTRAA